MQIPPAKSRPSWCGFQQLNREDLALFVGKPLWVELRQHPHLNGWCIPELKEGLSTVALRVSNGWYDTSMGYGKDYIAYAPVPLPISPELAAAMVAGADALSGVPCPEPEKAVVLANILRCAATEKEKLGESAE